MKKDEKYEEIKLKLKPAESQSNVNKTANNRYRRKEERWSRAGKGDDKSI